MSENNRSQMKNKKARLTYYKDTLTRLVLAQEKVQEQIHI